MALARWHRPQAAIEKFGCDERRRRRRRRRKRGANTRSDRPGTSTRAHLTIRLTGKEELHCSSSCYCSPRSSRVHRPRKKRSEARRKRTKIANLKHHSASWVLGIRNQTVATELNDAGDAESNYCNDRGTRRIEPCLIFFFSMSLHS